jgi:hypothetical protein
MIYSIQKATYFKRSKSLFYFAIKKDEILTLHLSTLHYKLFT